MILVLGAATTVLLVGETVAILATAPGGGGRRGRGAPGRDDPADLGVDALALGQAGAPGRVESAYAFDAIQLELVFIVGPLIAAGIATALTPAVSMFLCAGLYLLASVGFATAPAVRAAPPSRPSTARVPARSGRRDADARRPWPPHRDLLRRDRGGPARVHRERGLSAAAGPLITIWALGSVLGGLWYGSVGWRAPLERRLLVLVALLALAAAPLAFAGSITVMAVLLLFTGVALAPWRPPSTP